MTAGQVANALYGLKGFSESPELRGMLAALTPMLRSSTGRMTAKQVSNAMYARPEFFEEDSDEIRVLKRATKQVYNEKILK